MYQNNQINIHSYVWIKIKNSSNKLLKLNIKNNKQTKFIMRIEIYNIFF